MIKIVDQTDMLGGRRGKKKARKTERGLVAWWHIDISCPLPLWTMYSPTEPSFHANFTMTVKY
jgi:hypothetical protein